MASAGARSPSPRRRVERGSPRSHGLSVLLLAILLVSSIAILAHCAGRSGVAPASIAAAAIDSPPPESRPEPLALTASLHDREGQGEAGSGGAQTPPPAPRTSTLVHGVVRGPDGAPLHVAAHAKVGFVDHSGRRSTSDAKPDGTYSLLAVEPGSHWVTVRAAGHRILHAIVAVAAEEPVLCRDFTLEKAVELRIRVTTPAGRCLGDELEASGAPPAGRQLVPVATNDPPGPRFEEPATNDNESTAVGQFRASAGSDADKGCMGTLVLDGDLPVWVSLVHHQVVLQTRRVEPGAVEVQFVLSASELSSDLATLRARCVDAETGLPIQRASVTLSTGVTVDQSETTDEHGIAVLAQRAPGRRDLHVSAAGRETLHKSVDVPPGRCTDLGTLALAKAVTIEGRVVDPDGYPLAAAFSLGLLDPVDHSVAWLRAAGFRSGTDGRFVVPGLGRREYVLRTSNHDRANTGEWEGIDWVSGNLTVDARDGSVTGLELHLRPASKLVLRAATPVTETIRFRVFDEHGLELVAGRLLGTEPVPYELPAGRYRLRLVDAQGEMRSERVLTLGSASLELQLHQ